MTREEYIERLQEKIDEQYAYYDTLAEDDYVERGIVLGKINGLLCAKLLAHDIEYIK